MSFGTASAGDVTIVVVPRERFGTTEISLESLYAKTAPGFRLVYVDAGSPPRVRRYLSEQAERRGFELIRVEGCLSPNRARNIGLRAVGTRYVVFLDNDVVFNRGWLENLVECAEAEEAGIVSPLYLIGDLHSREVHVAGGVIEIASGAEGRIFRGWHRFEGRSLGAVRHRLRRRRCDYAEFHCMLVRTDFLNRLGGLDEGLLSAKEHIDLALQFLQRGWAIFLEPRAIIRYLAREPLKLADVDFYLLRWSEAWNRASLDHFYEKWNFVRDASYRSATNWLTRHRKLAGVPERPVEPGGASKSNPFGGIAQTNLQLYLQLGERGYEASELARIRSAYEVASLLFARLFRANGKPFLAHCVGTASILAAHGAPVEMVVAGLLHAAFNRYRANPIVRPLLKGFFGAPVDELLRTYARLGRGLRLPRSEAELDELDLTLARAAVIRMANDLEEELDSGPSLSAKSRASILEWWPLSAKVAERINFPGLPRALLAAREQAGEGFSPPAELRTDRKGSYRMRSSTLGLIRFFFGAKPWEEPSKKSPLMSLVWRHLLLRIAYKLCTEPSWAWARIRARLASRFRAAGGEGSGRAHPEAAPECRERRP